MRKIPLLVSGMLALASAALFACGPMNEAPVGAPAGTPGSTSSPVCSSNQMWGGGDGTDMNPGRDCIGCHASTGGEGPSYLAAGTVYGAPFQKDDCYGVSGATVQIIDKNGTVFSQVTGATGNFAFTSSDMPNVQFPITAKVVVNGLERAMTSAQSSGACDSCHTWNGASGAPGRVLTP